jgi:hypothetical protein
MMGTVYEESKDVSEKEMHAKETLVNIVIYRWVSRGRVFLRDKGFWWHSSRNVADFNMKTEI